MGGHTLALLVPGLLAPWPEQSGLPETPVLERILSRSTVADFGARGFEATLCRLFAVSAGADGDLPIAALTCLADKGCSQADRQYWLRADPVHLHADARQAILFDARSLAVTAAEAHALCELFNSTYCSDAYTLRVLHPQRWYLGLQSPPGIATHSLGAVIGKDIGALLPYGAQQTKWRALLTEAQMLLYASEINAAREAQGKPSINSLWLWGGGRLPDKTQCAFDAIYAADPLSRGLAQRAGITLSALPEHVQDWQQAKNGESHSLVIIDCLRYCLADDDLQDWQKKIRLLEQNWFAGLADLLNSKALAQLDLLPGNGALYRLTGAALRRFWRRPRALSGFLRKPPAEASGA